MKSSLDSSIKNSGQRCNACPKQLGLDAARARETGLLTDDIANSPSNTYAVERWHMLAAALIVG
jgi:hypothetical protein